MELGGVPVDHRLLPVDDCVGSVEMMAEQRVDAWMTGEESPPAGLKYLVDRYRALEHRAGTAEVDLQMNLIYDCLVRFIA